MHRKKLVDGMITSHQQVTEKRLKIKSVLINNNGFKDNKFHIFSKGKERTKLQNRFPAFTAAAASLLLLI